MDIREEFKKESGETVSVFHREESANPVFVIVPSNEHLEKFYSGEGVPGLQNGVK